MNEVRSTPVKEGTWNNMRTLKVERHETRAYEPKEYETAMVQPRNKNDIIWTALRLKMKEMNKNLRRLSDT